MKPPVKSDFKSKYFRLRISRSILAVLIIFIVAFFSWFLAFPQFGPIISEFFDRFQALGIDKGKWIMLFLGSMTISSLSCGYLLDRIRKRLLSILIITSVISILTFAFLWTDFSSAFLFAVPLGLLAGITPVAIGAYFANNTSPEDRGRIMGIAIGVAILISQIFLITGTLNIGSNTNIEVLVIGAVLLTTFTAIAFKPKENEKEIPPSKAKRGPPPKQIILYAIPMFLFYVVAGILLSIVFPTVQDHADKSLFYLIWAIPFMVGAILAGIQLDVRGRKFPTILGLAITGVSLAVFGILGLNLGFLCIIPLAIGYSYVTITSLIIWADLAPARASGLYYGIGFGLIAGAQLVGLILTGVTFGSASTSQINAYMLFSSIALFLCIPPLILAEEALPKELIEKRQLIDYLDGMKDKFGKKKEA